MFGKELTCKGKHQGRVCFRLFLNLQANSSENFYLNYLKIPLFFSFSTFYYKIIDFWVSYLILTSSSNHNTVINLFPTISQIRKLFLPQKCPLLPYSLKYFLFFTYYYPHIYTYSNHDWTNQDEMVMCVCGNAVWKKCTVFLLLNSCLLIYISLILEKCNKKTKQTCKQQQPKHHSLKLQRNLQ